MDNDKRENLRIDDDVIFAYRVLTETEDGSDLSLDPILQSASLTDALNELEVQGQSLRQKLALKQPKLAEYLHIQNRKITLLTDFVTKELIAKFLEQVDKRDLTNVNLSAGGLAFYRSEPIETEQKLKIKCVLLPEYECIISDAKVVSCLKQTNTSDYRIGVCFTSLTDHQEQLIAKHAFQKQLADRKQP